MFLAHFWSNFYILGVKIFLGNLALSCTTSYGFLAPCQNLEKLMMQFQENAQKDVRMEGETEGRTHPIS